MIIMAENKRIGPTQRQMVKLNISGSKIPIFMGRTTELRPRILTIRKYLRLVRGEYGRTSRDYTEG